MDPKNSTLVQGTSYLRANCSNYDLLERFYVANSRVHGYIALVICISGILGNIANIVVLSRPKMSSSPVNFLLTVIAASEMLLMITYIPHSLLYVFKSPGRDINVFRSKSTATLFYFCISFEVLCHSIAIWHTIAVAVFRWLTLGIPHGKLYSTMKNAYICSVVLIVANNLLTIPNWISNVVYNKTDQVTNEELWHLGSREKLQFNGSLFASFGKIVPCVLLTVLTLLLLCIMRQANLHRQQLLNTGNRAESKRQKEHNRTTGMLLAVVVIFLLIELPHGIVIILRTNRCVDHFYSKIGEVIDLLTLVAFSINFILYTVMSRLFRNTFFSLFCKKPIEQQASNIRRLSTMVTSVRMSVQTPKKSTAQSQLSNPSCQGQQADRLLGPSTPLVSTSSTQSTSVKSDSHSEHATRFA